MYTKTAAIIHKSGLHARPAADFVKEALKYKSSIKICNAMQPEKAVNAKSLVLVLSLSAACGAPVEVIANGDDEREAVDSLVALLETE